jgi:hypothetical protein
MSAGHLQVYLTQIASAFLRGPYTGLTLQVDESGPQPKEKPFSFTTEPIDGCLENTLTELEPRIMDGSVPQQCRLDNESHCDYPTPCHKALVPLSKLKGLIDEDDIPAVIDSRCQRCQNCPECKMSSRAKTRSHQEAFE